MGKAKEKVKIATRCEQCPLLGCPVMPRGCQDQPLVAFVGEAPGKEEAEQGKPFVGPSGKVLTQTIVEMDWELTQLYFTNTVMWRPPGNRAPKPDEIDACRDRLIRELTEIKPHFIVALGGTAANTLLGLPKKDQKGIMKLRGACLEIEIDGRKIPMMPTLHPAGILRQPDNWLLLREDLQKVEQILSGHDPIEQPAWDHYVIIDNQRMFDVLMDRLRSQSQLVAVDIETSHPSFNPNPDDHGGEILCVGFSWARGTAAILDWQRLIKGNEDNRLELAEVMAEINCSFQGGQYDNVWLWHREIEPNWKFDTMLAHYTVCEVQGTHGLKHQAVDRYWAPYYDDDLLHEMRDFRVGLRKLSKAHSNGVASEIGKSNGVASDPPSRRKHGSEPSTPAGTGPKTPEASEDRKLGLDIPIEAWSEPDLRQKIMKYCGADVDYTLRLSEDLPVEMEADGVQNVMERLLLPAAKHFTWLEGVGMKIDVDYLHQSGQKWIAEQEEISTDLYDLSDSWDRPETKTSGRPWFASHLQLAHYLYDELALHQMSYASLTEDGYIRQADVMHELQEIYDLRVDEESDEFSEEAEEYWRGASAAVFSKMKPRSVTAFMLLWLGHQHPFPRLMVPWKKLDKKITTYYEGYLDLLRDGGRIHPRYRVSGARTGRISCTDPNIHGVAKVQEIKRCFVADEDFEILYSDRSQAEIRMLAHVSGDQALREACESGDIHAAIACDLFGLTPDQMGRAGAEKVEYMRRAAKTIAFGIIYGRMPKSLAVQLGISIDEATKYRERFLSRMVEASRWMASQRQRGLRMREVESIYGRKRRFPGLVVPQIRGQHGPEIERQAVNTPIQGAVSDMTLEDNLRIIEALKERDIRVYPWPHIHDGFMIQVEKAKMGEAVEIAKDILAHPTFETKVHFAVELKTGPNWADLHTVHKG